MSTIENAILSAICAIVACKLGRSHVTVAEADAIYSSGEYPEINAEIDYILGAEEAAVES